MRLFIYLIHDFHQTSHKYFHMNNHYQLTVCLSLLFNNYESFMLHVVHHISSGIIIMNETIRNSLQL